MFMAGRSGAILPNEGCKYIQVDTDGGEIGRQLSVDVGIVSDVTQALVALNEEVAKDPFKVSTEWTEVAINVKKAPSPHEKGEKVIQGRLHPYFALKKLLSSLEPGAIISIDGGECGSWATDLTEISKPFMSLFSAGYLGMLGNGYGYSLGAAVAEPTRQVVNIQGDGSAGFHIAELDTYARHGLNILTVVVNNYVWGMSRHGQDILYGNHTSARPVSSLSPKTAYHTVAEGFGNVAARVDSLDDIETTVQRLSADKRPACIELLVADAPTHPTTMSMVSPTDDPNWIVIPYYDNIPRPFYKTTTAPEVDGHHHPRSSGGETKETR